MSEPDWVVVGGSLGETAYCQRCGAGLKLELPMPVDEVVVKMNEFVMKHSQCKPGEFKEPNVRTLEQWLTGRGVGVSSVTIVSVMTGRPFNSFYPHLFTKPNAPYDPSDFRRCYELLNLFPEWRGRIKEMGAAYPVWKGIADNWEELEKLYLEELESGRCPKLYKRIQELRGDRT